MTTEDQPQENEKPASKPAAGHPGDTSRLVARIGRPKSDGESDGDFPPDFYYVDGRYVPMYRGTTPRFGEIAPGPQDLQPWEQALAGITHQHILDDARPSAPKFDPKEVASLARNFGSVQGRPLRKPTLRQWLSQQIRWRRTRLREAKATGVKFTLREHLQMVAYTPLVFLRMFMECMRLLRKLEWQRRRNRY